MYFLKIFIRVPRIIWSQFSRFLNISRRNSKSVFTSCALKKFQGLSNSENFKIRIKNCGFRSSNQFDFKTLEKLKEFLASSSKQWNLGLVFVTERSIQASREWEIVGVYKVRKSEVVRKSEDFLKVGQGVRKKLRNSKEFTGKSKKIT